MSHVMNTYARLPVTFSHGNGCRITDTDGREYLDALSGVAVSTLGHAHPRLFEAIARQVGRMLHTSNRYPQYLAAGLLFNITADTGGRLLPPLIFGENEVRELVARCAPLIKEFLAA